MRTKWLGFLFVCYLFYLLSWGWGGTTKNKLDADVPVFFTPWSILVL